MPKQNNRVKSKTKNVTAKVKNVTARAKKRVIVAEKRMESYIHQHPARSALIAAGVGAALAGGLTAMRNRANGRRH